MVYRTKLLLSLLQELGGNLNSTELQNLLFLLCTQYLDNNIYYQFVSTFPGSVSFQAEEDKKTLVNKKLLENSEDWILLKNDIRYAKELDFFEKIAIQSLKNDLQNSSLKTADISQKIKHIPQDNILFTIGYEGISIDEFINKLLENDVKILCDVRKNAYSQKSGFTKQELAKYIKLAGLDYIHIPELGINSDKRTNLKEPLDYHELFKDYDATILPNNLASIDKLFTLLEQNHRIAITCFEQDHNCCHRGRVAKFMSNTPKTSLLVKHL